MTCESSECCNAVDDDGDYRVDEGRTLCAMPGFHGICREGRCALAGCGASAADCDGIEENGCEADLESPWSCGTCGVVCGADEICDLGTCRAPAWRLVAGGYHTCVHRPGGPGWCLGRNDAMQVATPASERELAWVPLGLERIDAMCASTDFTCALEGGAAWCWGGNDQGQAAPDDPTALVERPRRVPVPAEAGEARAITCGERHVCISTSSGAWCWGDDWAGQLGPMVQPRLGHIASGAAPLVAAGGNVTWMLDRGVISGWGAAIGAPRELARIDDRVRQLVAIGEHAVMLGEEGAAIWIGDTGITRRDDASLVAVAGRTSRFFCEISETGEAWCSGDGSRMFPATPMSLPPPIEARWMQVAVGWGHGCALGRSEGITCWGRNGDGQLSSGHRSDDPERAFAPIPGLLPD